MSVAQKTRTRPQSRMKAIQAKVGTKVTTITAGTVVTPATVQPQAQAVKQHAQSSPVKTDQTTTTAQAPKTTATTTDPAASTKQPQRQVELVDSARMTLGQSQALVKTFLEATVGTVAYLRGLLPEENFSDYVFAPPYVPPNSQPGAGSGSQRAPDSQAALAMAINPSQASQPTQFAPSQAAARGQGQGQNRGLKIKKVRKGYSPEADRLLEWMVSRSWAEWAELMRRGQDDGVMDAIEKRCLKSMIFGIYLDNDEPTKYVHTPVPLLPIPLIPRPRDSMCETYTCNFHYHPVPSDDSGLEPELGEDGTGAGTSSDGGKKKQAFVPSMTVHEGIAGLDIGGTGSEGYKTVADVKRSLRVGGDDTGAAAELTRRSQRLIKGLIVTCQNLAELPTRKWISMKLIYVDGTPSSYEPEHFRPVNATDKEWHFGTAGPDVLGDRYHIGACDDDHVGLNLKVISVVGDIPRLQDPPTDMQALQNKATMQSAASLLKRHREDEDTMQRESSVKRKYLWNVDDTAKDRMDIDPSGTGSVRPYTRNDPIGPAAPFAIRHSDGTLGLLGVAGSTSKRQTNGIATEAITEAIPPSGAELDKTYATKDSQEKDLDGDVRMTEAVEDILGTVKPGKPAQKPSQDRKEETQLSLFPATQHNVEPESIESFSQEIKAATEAVLEKSKEKSAVKPTSKATGPADKVACPCGCTKENGGFEWVQCDDCKTWSHVVCLGYLDNNGLADVHFSCPSCVYKESGPSRTEAAIFKANLHDKALFRLALFVARRDGRIESLSEFGKALGVNRADATNVVQRLQEDGFLELTATTIRRKAGESSKVWRYCQANESKVARYLVPSITPKEESHSLPETPAASKMCVDTGLERGQSEKIASVGGDYSKKDAIPDADVDMDASSGTRVKEQRVHSVVKNNIDVSSI